MKVTSYMIEAHVFKWVSNEIKYLILKRSEDQIYPGIWQMVTGTIAEGEKAHETALREIAEETSLKAKKMWVVPFVNSFYSYQKDSVCMVPVFCVEVDRNDKVILSGEHSEFKWVDVSEAKKLFAWEGQRRSLEIINQYLTEENSALHFTEIPLIRR